MLIANCTKTSVAFLILALSSSFAGRAVAQAADEPAHVSLERTVDASIRPGDDFYAYANGAWLEATTIPAGKERWGARDEIGILVRGRIARLLDDARTAPPGSDARKVADFRAAYLNEAAIESKGLSAITPTLDSIDRIRSKGELVRMLGSSMRADVDPLNYGVFESSYPLGLSVEPSIHGEKSYVAFLVEGGLGLPDRLSYIRADGATQVARASYQSHLARVFTAGGFDHAALRAAGVLALETSLARSHATPEAAANDHNADVRWTRADFAKRAPGIDWAAYFAAAGLSTQDSFVPWQPGAVTGFASLVTSQPLESWKDYLRVHLLDRYADVLPRRFASEASTQRRASGAAANAEPLREQRAIDATQLAMSDAIGKMYVERFFPAERKARVQVIVANVTAAFLRELETVSWMSPATRALALTKIRTLYVGVGYPEGWQDFSDLVVDPADAAGNLRRVADRNYRRSLALLGKRVDLKSWWMAPQTVGAILVFQQNMYDFPAALLLPPKFDPAASDAASYGAVGALIGHDITHFVDVLGAEYDTAGAERRWWSAEDSARFESRAEPLVKQFSAYRPFADAGIDGKRTRTENVADLGGLVAAFEAYRKALGAKAGDTAEVRAQDREFFIAFAQGMRTKMSEAGTRAQMKGDHAPEAYRVATVRNLDAWYNAFDVVPGQRLYLEPSARVKVW